MSPHDVNPTPRTIDVDVSAILVHPRLPERVDPGRRTELVLLGQIKPGPGSRNIRISPFGWANISFVLGSCLIALLCTLFVSENAQHFRRRANLTDNVVYSKPNVDFPTRTLSLDPSQLVSSVQLDRPPRGVFDPEQATTSPNQSLLPPSPLGENQSSSGPLSADRTAGNGPANNSSSARSSSAGQNGLSRATTSRSISSNGSQRSGPVRSSTTRLARNSRKQSISTRSNNLNSRQSLRRSSAGTAGKPATQTTSNLKLGNQQLHRGLEAQTATVRSQMSMHAMGQGSVAPQIQGTMNPMRMESGMLAQPAIGGVAGQGLGGVGRHGGSARR